jgi:hypothetical protein
VFVGEKSDGETVRHLDGNNFNDCLTNLCWGSWEEQWDDKRKHQTDTSGERNPTSKLNWEIVRYIRNASDTILKLKGKYVKIAKLVFREYGLKIHNDTIGLVIKNKTWIEKH